MLKNLILMALLLLALSACGANNEEEALDQPQPTTFENVGYSTTDTANEAFNFTAFDLEVDYVDTLSYGIDYTKNKTQQRAVIHEIGEERITGEEAMNQLTPLFREMSFDAHTSEEEVISEVIETLGLDETYKEFKLKVIYRNGKEFVYED